MRSFAICCCVLISSFVGAGNVVGQSLWDVSVLGSEAPPFPAISSSQPPSGFWSDNLLSQPVPTNRWWQNFVLGSGDNTCNALPYLVQAHPEGLKASMPGQVVTADFVLSTFVANWTLGAMELATEPHEVSAFDDLSVTLSWSAGSGAMQAPVVRGMSGLTMKYEALTPRISTIHALLSVNGNAPGVHTGNRFECNLNNGSTWVVHTSEEVTFSVVSNGLQMESPWTGQIRLTVLSSGDGLVNMDADVVDAHVGTFSVGGTVDLEANGNEGSIVFSWLTETMSNHTPTAPLMFALPHQQDILAEPTTPNCSLTTIKGSMLGVTSNEWNMTESLTPIGFESTNPIPEALVPSIVEALGEDVNFPVTAGDTYFGGKQLAALGRLALIADELGETGHATAIRSNLSAALTPWLSGTNSDPLRYDSDWGGVITTSGGSFDQGVYNDHHFHYGYFLYAAAALAKEDAAWAAQWGDEVDHLVRNLANPSSSDPHYTQARNKDWFVGHSWASGLFAFGDGRNQESSSEAVNAWYGVYLWGLATGRTDLADLGRFLLATEIRSTHKYWQVDSGDGIYPEPYASRKVVGVLWSTKVDHGTFFGANLEFIHGIQMLPFTPITEELLEPVWVGEAYPVMSQALNSPDIGDGWKGFIYSTHAVIDPVAAWDEVNTLNGHDDGNTLTNTLYWIATRPGAEAINPGSGTGGGSGVTFHVDMNNETLLNGAVYLTGGSIDAWCGTCNLMSDLDGDGVYSITLNLPPGAIEYKFVNGDWSAGEALDPTEDGACTLTTGEFTNRYFVVPSSGAAELPVVCFNACDACIPTNDCPSDTNNNGICDTDDIPGCTYPAASNFNPNSTMDDGSCVYDQTVCPGDLTGDGLVTVVDLLELLGVFGDSCP
ncbi:MAG: glycosyl hydrolase [Flavobacteriales bacterium]